MGATLIYQGQEFPLSNDIGYTAQEATDWLQEQIMLARYARDSQIDERGYDIPPGRRPADPQDLDGHQEVEPYADGAWTIFPFSGGSKDPLQNYVRVPLGNGETLFLWIDESLQFAVQGLI